MSYGDRESGEKMRTEKYLAHISEDGSREQTVLEQEYTEMSKIVKNGTIHSFSKGGHPAVATNAEKFAEIVLNFLNS